MVRLWSPLLVAAGPRPPRACHVAEGSGAGLGAGRALRILSRPPGAFHQGSRPEARSREGSGPRVRVLQTGPAVSVISVQMLAPSQSLHCMAEPSDVTVIQGHVRASPPAPGPLQVQSLHRMAAVQTQWPLEKRALAEARGQGLASPAAGQGLASPAARPAGRLQPWVPSTVPTLRWKGQEPRVHPVSRQRSVCEPRDCAVTLWSPEALLR